MKSSHTRLIVVSVLLLVPLMTSLAGGWAVVTVKDMPAYLVAGKPTTLEFTVRQHGFSLTDGLKAAVSASASGGLSAKGLVTPKGSGEYTTSLTIPQPGEWTIRIDTGAFGDFALLPVKAIRADSPAPAALSLVSRGEQLYVAKGCVACHINAEVAARNLVSVGPELTGRKFQAEFFRKLLADPAATLGKAPERAGMPNLSLSNEEIAAIEAFVNRDRTAVAAKTK